MIKLQAKPFDINIIQVYAPTSSCSKEVLEDFYEDIERAVKQCKSQEKTIIQGDFNDKVGEGRSENIVGPHSLETQNEHGKHPAEWLKQHDMVIANTWFKVPVQRKWTWRSPDSNTRNQMDYILIRERLQNALKSCKAYPGADCGSDHNPVIAKVELKLRKLEKKKQNKKRDIQQLQLNEETRIKYAVEVSNQLQALAEVEDLDEQWKVMKESITTAVQKMIPIVERKAKQKWMTEDILEKMDDRRKSKGNLKAELVNEIRAMFEQVKKDWLNKKCQELERLHSTDTKNTH